MKTLSDRRFLVFWIGVGFMGCTLLMSELGCGQLSRLMHDDRTYGMPPDRVWKGESESLGQIQPTCAPPMPASATPMSFLSGGEQAVPVILQPAKPKLDTAPTLWKRDRKRPSFARVYVGDGNSLELVSLHVSVTIDGPRARTTVDHIFRNPHDKQLEGTFEYPLPTGASPSYFAMFLGQTRDTPPPRFTRKTKLNDEQMSQLKPVELVKHVEKEDWGKLQEARIVAKDKALETYEEVVRSKIDPALLEYAGGNTFSGRVFPIPSKGYNRVILAYEETLPVSGDDMIYRFALPDCKLKELQLIVEAKAKKGIRTIGNVTNSEQIAESAVCFRDCWKDDGELPHLKTPPKGEAVYRFPNTPAVQTLSTHHDGSQYIYTRIRPKLEAKQAAPFAEHAVFLLDTSLSENPDRFNVSIKLMKHILQGDPDIKKFNVLTFDVNARWLEPRGWFDNTSEGRETVLSRLNGVLLEGATDLGATLDKLCSSECKIEEGTPLNIFLLSDGQITWGEAEVAQLVAKFETRCPYPTRFHCYRTGLGADNAELFEALTRRGGGVFNCFGEGDLAAAAHAHRHQCWQIDSVRFKGGPVMSDVLVAGRKAALYPDGELIVAARVAGDKAVSAELWPTLVVEGRYLGQKKIEEYPLKPEGSSELAARAWGEIAVASLLSANDPKLDPVVTAYCQQFSIGSKVASFLVLENENDYKRLNLEEERGKTIKGDLASFLNGLFWEIGKPLSEREVFDRFLTKADAKVKLFDSADGKHVKKLLSLLEDADFDLPPTSDGAALMDAKAVPSSYLSARKKDPRNVNTYIAEAKRRAEEKEPNRPLQELRETPWTEVAQWRNQRDASAVRALSCIVEQHPGRADALRLVGYRLLDLKQPSQAARLFQQVERNRPFEPHSYRDLARSLQESGKYGLAAVQYEIVLAGTWHNRFHESLKVVAREEYVQMMQQAIRDKAVSAKVADHFGERLEGLSAAREPSDLRVSVSWNTDATDVDLWVIEPDGTKVFYSSPRSKSGGELSQDQTQGYGPERYHIAKAQGGEYKVIVHNFTPNPNLLGGESHVHVVVTRYAGTPRETVQRYNVILKNRNEEVEVTRVKF